MCPLVNLQFPRTSASRSCLVRSAMSWVRINNMTLTQEVPETCARMHSEDPSVTHIHREVRLCCGTRPTSKRAGRTARKDIRDVSQYPRCGSVWPVIASLGTKSVNLRRCDRCTRAAPLLSTARSFSSRDSEGSIWLEQSPHRDEDMSPSPKP